MIVPVLFVLLAAEITVAASIVMAQPGGAASLFPFGNVNFGPERRQSVPAQDLPLNGQAANITINSMGGLVEITGDPSLTAVKVEGTKIVHSFGDADFNRIAFSVAQDGANINIVAKAIPILFFTFEKNILILLSLLRSTPRPILPLVIFFLFTVLLSIDVSVPPLEISIDSLPS